MKKRYIAPLAAAAVVLSLCSGCAVADGTYGYYGGPYGHPNIAAADSYTAQAIASMHAAQTANDAHLGGHAGRAIQLLQEARYEIAAAGESASR